MSLGIRPTTSRERKQLFIETLLNNTDKVTKVSPNSVVGGLAAGVAKISGKAEKDLILALSQLFPDTAFGDQLDQVARNFGLSDRFGASQSSTYLRVVGDVGTVYTQGVHTFTSTSGTVFELENTSETIGAHGFEYIKVRSTTQGEVTNVDALSITAVTPVPVGHQFVINETQGFGGRDIEDDEQYRIRIKDGANLLARGTLESITQVFMSINEKVLTCFYYGVDLNGKNIIAVATQNGVDLSQAELDELLDKGGEFFCLSDVPFLGNEYHGILLQNVEYQAIDISFRLDFDASFDIDDIRRQILVTMTKYLDFRTFDPTNEKVEWDNLLQIAKDTPGVKYVPDQYFFPRTDVTIDQYKMPRMRGFLILDMTGAIITDISGNLSPVFYPSNPDFSFVSTVLNP